MITTADAERQYVQFLEQNGLKVTGSIVADGQLHRCDVAGKGKAGKNDGTYLVHIHPTYAAGGCQNWCESGDGNDDGWVKWKWMKPGWKPTKAEQAEINRRIELARTTYEKDLANRIHAPLGGFLSGPQAVVS